MRQSLRLSLVAFAFVCTAALAAPPLEALIKKDEKELAGTWYVQSAENGGKKIPPQAYRDLRLTYKNGKFTAHKGKEKPEEGTYKLDPSKKPKAIDVTHSIGRDKVQTQLAIYELKGNTFKICSCVTGKERPTTFDTTDKPEYVMMVLKRVP
jgi:uncharacterized protein (TIGR03067 family)